jgi:hypothetical protein
MLEMHSRHVYMHTMNMSFDLNLLLIFDAVMRGGHSAARRKLNASALAALRHLEIRRAATTPASSMPGSPGTG